MYFLWPVIARCNLVLLIFNDRQCTSPLDSCLACQAALLRQFESLPEVFHTDSVTFKGQNELLERIAQYRILQAGK